MPHDRGPLPTEMGRYVSDVRKKRIQRIILILAPPRGPEAPEHKNVARAGGSQPGGNPYPVIGIEVVAAMQDDDGRLATRAALRPEGTVKYRNISRLNCPCSMQRLVHGSARSGNSAIRLRFSI